MTRETKRNSSKAEGRKNYKSAFGIESEVLRRKTERQTKFSRKSGERSYYRRCSIPVPAQKLQCSTRSIKMGIERIKFLQRYAKRNSVNVTALLQKTSPFSVAVLEPDCHYRHLCQIFLHLWLIQEQLPLASRSQEIKIQDNRVSEREL